MKTLGLLAAGMALLMASYATPAAAHSLEGLEEALLEREPYVEIVHREAPDFVLKDAEGRAVGLADFRGKVVVLHFIYASCPDVCPIHSSLVAKVQEQLNGTPMRDLVQFLTITTDPVNDTPEVLKSYGPARGLDPVNWVFLTSGPEEPDATRRLAERFGLRFTKSEEGLWVHAVVTHLIDKSGLLRARYHGLKFNPTNMILHLNALVNDEH